MAASSPEIRRSAAKEELEAVEPRTRRQRIVREIRALAREPRPAGCQKLAGTSSASRIRVGDFRVLYEVFDEDERVTVVKIGHRREVYR